MQEIRVYQTRRRNNRSAAGVLPGPGSDAIAGDAVFERPEIGYDQCGGKTGIGNPRLCRIRGATGDLGGRVIMRSASCLAAAALAAMAVLPAGPAASQSFLNKLIPGMGGGSPEVWKVCEGQDGAALDKQIEACTAVIDLGGEMDAVIAGAYTNRGNALRDSGEMERAIQDFNKAISLDSKLAAGFAGRAAVFVAKGQLDFAILDYNQAIKLNPKNVDTYYFNRGTTYSLQGQYDQSRPGLRPGDPRQSQELGGLQQPVLRARQGRPGGKRRCRIAKRPCGCDPMMRTISTTPAASPTSGSANWTAPCPITATRSTSIPSSRARSTAAAWRG